MKLVGIKEQLREPKAKIKQARKTPGEKTTRKEMIGPFGEELMMHWQRFQSIGDKMVAEN